MSVPAVPGPSMEKDAPEATIGMARETGNLLFELNV